MPTAFTYHLMLTSPMSLSPVYISPLNFSLIHISHYLNPNSPNLNSLPPPLQRATLPFSSRCLSQSPCVPTLIINHKPLRMLPPHYLPSLSIFLLPRYHYAIIIIIITIIVETALKQFFNF